MDGKFLTQQTEDLVAKFLYNLTVQKVPFFLRFVLKKIISIVLAFVGKYADKVIPDAVDNYINIAITELFKGNYDAASLAIGTAGNMLVDIPKIDEDYEQKAFVNASELLVNLIKNSIKNRDQMV